MPCLPEIWAVGPVIQQGSCTNTLVHVLCCRWASFLGLVLNPDRITQAVYHDGLLSTPGMLSQDEQAVLRWGGNSGAVAPPRHVDRVAYKKATAFEVLVSRPQLLMRGRHL